MKCNRIIIVAVGVFLFSQVAFGEQGEVAAGSGGENAQASISSRVIMSSGSMRLVRYTRHSVAGETNYIRREAVGGGERVGFMGGTGNSQSRLVSNATDSRGMQSHYVVSKPTGNVVRYAPARAEVVGKGHKVVARPVEGFGNVYKRQGYTHPAYMKSNSKVYGRSPVEQVHYGTGYSGGGIYRSDGVSVSVTVINGFSWSSGSKGYSQGSYNRHVKGCGCGCGVGSRGYVSSRRGYYGGYGYKPRSGYTVRRGYPRALGDGMYVSKQPRYGYGNYGVRYVARTSNYGHTLTIGGCGGRRY